MTTGRFVLCLALMLHLGQSEVFGQQTFGTRKADRMAASDQDKDFVHRNIESSLIRVVRPTIQIFFHCVMQSRRDR